jgi:hypothetical protein
VFGIDEGKSMGFDRGQAGESLPTEQTYFLFFFGFLTSFLRSMPFAM